MKHWWLLFALSTLGILGCGSDDGANGSGGSAGSDAGLGGGGGSGGAGGSGGGAGGSDAGPTEPPILCTDQCVYVRPDATGANSGVDWNDALTSIPAALTRGKVYLLADGSYGDHSFSDPASGTDVIHIRKATVASHGTDVGWQPDYGDGVALFSGVSFDGSYYVLDGAQGGGKGAWNSGHGIEIERSGSACGDNGSLIGFAAGASNITVKHVHAHANNNDYPMNGVKGTYGASSLTFSYDSIHTTFGPTFHIADWSDVVIEYSYLADVRSTGSVDAFCPDWHAEGISSIGQNDNLTIRYNLWDEIGGTAVIAGVNQGASKGWQIYGNTFSRSVTTLIYYDEPGTSNHQSMDDLQFINNAIVHMPGSSVGVISIPIGSNNVVSNNIWYDNIANTFSFAGVTHDYNYFAENRRVEGCSPVCDKNDEGAQGESNAQIASGSPYVAGDGDPVSADFSLSAATDPGTTLPAPFEVDPDGKKRGADGVWDRGVFELAP